MKGSRPLLSLIVPTYNEKGNMSILIPELGRILGKKEIPFEILVMDDDSPDGTANEVRRLSADHPYARCIERKENRGLSPAVIEGFSIAKGDVFLVMDADLSHPPKAVPELYDAIVEGGADISVGSRHVKGGEVEKWPASRRFISWGASTLARPLTNCSDPMSGFFALRPEVIKGSQLAPKGYKILLEILVKGDYSKMTEVPIIFRDRTIGESKLGKGVMFQYIAHLFKLYRYPGSAPFFKFLFVGGSGMLVDLSFVTLFLYLMGEGETEYYIAQTLSFTAAVVWNFFWNRYWTFNARAGSSSGQFVKFLTVAVIAYALRTGLSLIGTKLIGIADQPYYQIMLLIVIVIVTVINYLGSKLWAFKR